MRSQVHSHRTAGDGGGATQLGRDLHRSDARRPRRCSPVTSWSRLNDNAPSVAEGIARLYTALRELQRLPQETDGGSDPRTLITPETWVRDYIQSQRNHYPELEGGVRETCSAARWFIHISGFGLPLRQRLKDAWGVEVRIVVSRKSSRTRPSITTRSGDC